MAVKKGSGNVYADLELPDAELMLIKAKLVAKISEIIRSKGWTKQEAATVLKMALPQLSNMFRGHFRNISEVDIRGYLAKLNSEQ